ncbi:MAG: VOC family protein [Candidatus Eremiobacteraeota bacterium]|nr:VOC family protein [Candidatus Eremiobacteraeota bacterium]
MSVSTQNFRVTGIDMTGYMAKDTKRALDFYRSVLGLEPTTLYPNDMGAEYEFADGTTFGIWNPGDQMPFRSSGGVMFAVDDLDAAVKNAKDCGIPIHLEHESPGCFMAMTEDSEGNQIVLHKRKNT